MSWSSVHVPNSIRWLGAGLGWTGALGEIWALVYLGRQYSPILRVRRGHELVVQGQQMLDVGGRVQPLLGA